MKGVLDCFYTISPVKYLGFYLANVRDFLTSTAFQQMRF